MKHMTKKNHLSYI